MKPVNIRGWNGFQLSSADVCVGIVPSIGGRIMSLTFKGQELLFIDPEYEGQSYQVEAWQDLAHAKRQLGFRVWGGDKTWIAPQSSWIEGIPPLDLDAAAYHLDWQDGVALMSSPVCRETGLQIIRRVSLKEGEVHLWESVHNRSSVALRKGLWNVTQVRRPCRFVIPAAASSFRDYHIEDATLPVFKGSLEAQDGVLEIDCARADLFKIGGEPLEGRIDIRLHRQGGDIHWKKIFDHLPGAVYAHGSALEVFNSSRHPYAEIEIHAPLIDIPPQGSVTLKQRWQISACPSKT